MSDSQLKAAVDAYRTQHPGADPEACDQFHRVVGELRRNGRFIRTTEDWPSDPPGMAEWVQQHMRENSAG